MRVIGAPHRALLAERPGVAPPALGSSISKLIQHCRAKYSLGSSFISGQKPPNPRTCSSSRHNQYGAQPPPASRNTKRSSGCRSITPWVISCAHASICSNACETACMTSGLNGLRSLAERLDRVRRGLVDSDGDAELFGELPERLVRGMRDRATETRIRAAGTRPGSRARRARVAARRATRRSIATAPSRPRTNGPGRPRSTTPTSRCRPRERRCRVGVGDRPEVEPERRVQDREVDAFERPCRSQSDHGIEATGLRLVVGRASARGRPCRSRA